MPTPSPNGTVVVSEIASGDATLSNVTCNAGDTILVGICARDENDTFSVSDDDGNTYTKRREDDDDQCATQIFSAVASSNGPIEITVDASTANFPLVCYAQAFQDVDTTTNDGVEAADGAIGDPDDDDMLATITTLTDGALVVGVGTSRTQTLTLPMGETEISINDGPAGTGGDRTIGHMWYQAAPTAGSIQLGDTADLSGDIDWTLSLVALKPSAAGGSEASMLPAMMQAEPFAAQGAFV